MNSEYPRRTNMLCSAVSCRRIIYSAELVDFDSSPSLHTNTNTTNKTHTKKKHARAKTTPTTTDDVSHTSYGRERRKTSEASTKRNPGYYYCSSIKPPHINLKSRVAAQYIYIIRYISATQICISSRRIPIYIYTKQSNLYIVICVK